MRLKPFLLDAWLDTYEHGIEFNLAASSGPIWTANQLLDLGGEQARERYLNHKVVYSRPAGADTLREAIAEMQGVSVDCVQVVTGASEALTVLMWLAAEPGANVILPLPGFTTFSALPESLGIEMRFYRVRRENNFQIDLDEIKRLADSRTKLILVNSPHNPTGATMSDAEMETLHEFASQRGIQLVSDEVYHPILSRSRNSIRRAPAARHGDQRPVESLPARWDTYRMDDRARRPAARAILDRACLLLGLQQHPWRNPRGDRHPQSRRGSQKNSGSRQPESATTRSLHGRS
jgi:DNA-binding transcriptional MocR family regulator